MAAQPSQKRSRVVFIGNLPYDHTEEQLIDVFESVGPVVSFRLVFDRATGKPKGFGFCEYKDAETAASALRNLQGVDVGGRGLRLDFADSDEAPNSRQPRGIEGSGARSADTPADREPPKPLPAGVNLPPGASATDNITTTLATMPPDQLLSVLTQMKGLVTSSPQDARALLSSNPQLTYALFQAMLLMNIVDPGVIQKMVQAPSAAAPTYPPQVPSYPSLGQPNPTPSYPQPASYGGRPAPMSYPPPHMQAPQGGYGYSMPPPQQPPPQAQSIKPFGAAPGGPPGIAPDQAALVAQVLSMSQQQIDSLPPESRHTIMQIRQQADALKYR